MQKFRKIEDCLRQEVGQEFYQILIILCATERQKHGILQAPKQNDCEWLPCQHNCPIKQLPDLKVNLRV